MSSWTVAFLVYLHCHCLCFQAVKKFVHFMRARRIHQSTSPKLISVICFENENIGVLHSRVYSKAFHILYHNVKETKRFLEESCLGEALQELSFYYSRIDCTLFGFFLINATSPVRQSHLLISPCFLPQATPTTSPTVHCPNWQAIASG